MAERRLIYPPTPKQVVYAGGVAVTAAGIQQAVQMAQPGVEYMLTSGSEMASDVYNILAQSASDSADSASEWLRTQRGKRNPSGRFDLGKRKRGPDGGNNPNSGKKPKGPSGPSSNNKQSGMPRKGSNRRTSLRTRKTRKKLGRAARRKTRKRSKRVKARTKIARIKNLNGPIGETNLYVPNQNAVITPKYNDVHDLAVSNYFKVGTVTAAAGFQNWKSFPLMSYQQFAVVVATGQSAGETSTLQRGLFNPAPLGISGTSGAPQGAQNYFKIGEKFRVTRMEVEIFLANANDTPARVWVDDWVKRNNFTNTTGAQSPDVVESLYQSYSTQDFFTGLAPQTPASQSVLFSDPDFDTLKVAKLQTQWKHKDRKSLFLKPGDEIGLKYVYKNITVDTEQRQDQPAADAEWIPKLSHNYHVCVRGLMGRDNNGVGQFSAAEVTAGLKVRFRGYRVNVMNTKPKTVIFNSVLEPLAPVGAVVTYHETIQPYS